MNCRKFESQLERFLAERLPPASMQECRAHLGSCPTCRELLDLATREPIPVEPVQTEELVQAVLGKTSGKSCRQAHDLLPDYVDDVLAKASRELIDQHLENCPSCQQVHQTMRELKEALPGLAQMDPGSSFTSECMQAIRRLPTGRLQSKISSGRIWHRLLARPRLAWESGYVLALLFFVLFNLFTSMPGLSQVEAIGGFQAKRAQIGASVASSFKKDLSEWSISLTDRQDRWAKASSKKKEELITAMIFMGDKTKQYSQSTSNAVIQFLRSFWNGIAGKVEKMFPKDRART